MVSPERACQEEQNGANLSSVAPSSEELWVLKEKSWNTYVYYSLWPETDFGKKGHHWKAHLKRNRMAKTFQIFLAGCP